MDVVAHQLHARLDSAMTKSSIIDLMTPLRRGAQAEAADKVHAARHSPQEEDRAWAPRAAGWEAAHLMLDLFSRLPESHDDPVTPFTRLSLSLNASHLANMERDIFVARVREELDDPWGVAASLVLVPLVREYLRDGDALRLVAQAIRTRTLVT